MMDDTLICSACGNVTPRKAARQKYCPGCAKTVGAEKNRQKAHERYMVAKAAGTLKQGKKLGHEGTRYCANCGKQIENAKSNRTYCANCAGKEKDLQQADKRQRAKAPEPLPKKDYAFLTPSAAPPEWSLKGKSADQVEAEARALGLSYGQYSAYCSSGLIVRYCRERGVDGIATAKKAWREFKKHQKRLHEGNQKQKEASGTA